MEEVLEKIEDLIKEPGFVFTLALILMRDLFFDPEDAADINWHDHLNFQEITFLVGLLVKNEINFEIPTEEVSANRFEQVYQLFHELHQKHHEHFLARLKANLETEPRPRDLESAKEDYRRTFSAGNMMTEPIFYSGSGAYDFQYFEFAVGKYQNDEAWINQHMHISVPDMVRIARELKALHERKFNTRPRKQPGDFSSMCVAGLSIFCFDESDLLQFGADTTRAFLKAFSLIPGKVNATLRLAGQYNQLQSRPIIQLPDGRYFLPVGFNLSEAIYESPFYWMNADSSYTSAASLHRGQFSEEATANILSAVFGSAHVYRDVEVQRMKGEIVTDIDVLAIVGNKAVVAQVKSKRLTELAKLGNEQRLADDFNLAVQEAYGQGLLCRQALIDRRNKLLIGGKEIHLSESIDDVYILCVTLDHYPAVMHHADVLLKKQPDDPFPVALSIFDLDVLAFYLTDPFEFAYYLRQRILLGGYFKADTEMSLLGFHLKHKLFKGDEADFAVVGSDFAQLVDANFPVLRGSVPKTAAADKLRTEWKNEDFQDLVDQAKSTGEPRFTDAVFFLYDLAGKGADELIKTLKLLKRKSATDRQSHDARVLLSAGRSGITILSEPLSAFTLRKKLLALARMAKYKSKAHEWLALGFLATSANLVDAIAFSKAPWKADPVLEELATHLRGKVMTPAGKKIGRNEPCPCGNGKKFKRCHGK
jgi:hypothetical protein